MISEVKQAVWLQPYRRQEANTGQLTADSAHTAHSLKEGGGSYFKRRAEYPNTPDIK